MEKVYTSDEILAMDDLYTIAEYAANLVPVYYRLTYEEMEWWDFVDGRYSIADYIFDHCIPDDGDTIILKIDGLAIGEALTDDGTFPKAVCLSDDTALQKLFFWCAIEPSEEE